MKLPLVMETPVGVLFMAFVMLAGCAGTPASTRPEESARLSQRQFPTASLAVASHQPAPDGEGSRLSGTLGADAVEGGCAYLLAPDGTRHEVIYPRGWRVELSPLHLVGPDGSVIAKGGDRVTVVGQPADDMASICQIGPIFRATAVEP